MKNLRKKKGKATFEGRLEAGAFKDRYLLYARKSTDEADHQKNSILYQKSELAKFAERETLAVAPITIEGFCTKGVIVEKHSGFKEDNELEIVDGVVQYRIERPKFQRLLMYLSRGQIKGIVCLCWDRISRNRGDDTLIRKLMRNGADIRFVYASYDRTSAGELHMDIDAMFAQHHSRVTSEKVTLATRSCRERGICTYRAPIGYLNPGRMDEKPIDPDRGPVIADMFRYYATGGWSLADLARYAATQGFTTVPMRRRRSQAEILADEDESLSLEKVSRPITENHVSRILRNRFYTGRILGPDGQYIESTSHEALVDDMTFERVQELLAGKTVSRHYTKKLDYPFRGFVRCAFCDRVYTPYAKKGHLYFGARCLRGCANTKRSINLAFVEREVRAIIASLAFTEEELAEMDARMSTQISLLHEQEQKAHTETERQKKALREKLAYLDANRLELLQSGAFSPEMLVAEQSKLETGLSGLRTKEAISDEALRATMADVRKVSELLKNAALLYNKAKTPEKERIARIVLSELRVAQNTLEYNVQPGFEPFKNRIDANCDPKAWLSELFFSKKKLTLAKNIINDFAVNNKLIINLKYNHNIFP